MWLISFSNELELICLRTTIVIVSTQLNGFTSSNVNSFVCTQLNDFKYRYVALTTQIRDTIHHYHLVVPSVRISLTLSRYLCKSFIASCTSSGLHTVSFVEDGMYLVNSVDCIHILRVLLSILFPPQMQHKILQSRERNGIEHNEH